MVDRTPPAGFPGLNAPDARWDADLAGAGARVRARRSSGRSARCSTGWSPTTRWAPSLADPRLPRPGAPRGLHAADRPAPPRRARPDARGRVRRARGAGGRRRGAHGGPDRRTAPVPLGAHVRHRPARDGDRGAVCLGRAHGLGRVLRSRPGRTDSRDARWRRVAARRCHLAVGSGRRHRHARRRRLHRQRAARATGTRWRSCRSTAPACRGAPRSTCSACAPRLAPSCSSTASTSRTTRSCCRRPAARTRRSPPARSTTSRRPSRRSASRARPTRAARGSPVKRTGAACAGARTGAGRRRSGCSRCSRRRGRSRAPPTSTATGGRDAGEPLLAAPGLGRARASRPTAA